MGSYSDWETMKNTAAVLDEFGVKYDKAVISAHRMPEEMMTFAKDAVDNGVEVIIAGAGGAAHLPGMVAANTVLPVIGVPVQSRALNGLDSLLSIVQMPAGFQSQLLRSVWQALKMPLYWRCRSWVLPIRRSKKTYLLIARKCMIKL